VLRIRVCSPQVTFAIEQQRVENSTESNEAITPRITLRVDASELVGITSPNLALGRFCKDAPTCIKPELRSRHFLETTRPEHPPEKSFKGRDPQSAASIDEDSQGGTKFGLVSNFLPPPALQVS
jgi:hypothetical protein